MQKNSVVAIGNEQGERYFDRLPDEIVISIFSKVLDLEELVYCFTLSKRFSTLVLKVHSLSIAYPRRKPHCNNSEEGDEAQNRSLTRKVLDLVARPYHFIRRLAESKPMAELMLDQYAFTQISQFLGKFQVLRFVQMELPFVEGPRNYHVMKWAAVFGEELEIFVILLSKRLRKIRKDTQIEEAEDRPCPGYVLVEEDKFCVLKHNLNDALFRHHMLTHVVRVQPLLRDAVVTDSNGRGRVYFRGSNQVSMPEKGCDSHDFTASMVHPLHVRIWNRSYVSLPASGVVLEEATLMVAQLQKPGMEPRVSGCSDMDGGSVGLKAAAGACEEGDEILAEAVAMMVKRHGHGFAVAFRHDTTV